MSNQAEAGRSDGPPPKTRVAGTRLGRRRWARGAGALAAGALTVLALSVTTVAHDPITTKITFAREIRAILASRCIVCHAPGGSAPMALVTYQEVRPWARAIKEQVLARRMPQWHAARGFGAFNNDPTLTPVEIAMVAAWVDGGLPRGSEAAATAADGQPAANVRPGPARPAVVLRLAARGDHALVKAGERWVTGWSFEPGDPLITSATLTSDSGTIGTWTAGDVEARLPPGSAMRVAGTVRLVVRRRPPADYERRYLARASLLRLSVRTTRPSRLVWTEEMACGVTRSGMDADLVAVRPMLDAGAAARIWVEKAGAPQTIIGWFRDFDPRYPRTYWLARPAALTIDAGLQSDNRCRLQLTLLSHAAGS